MFKVIQNYQSYVEAMADAREDMEDAPTNLGAGSSCLVIEDSSVWMLGCEDQQWHEL